MIKKLQRNSEEDENQIVSALASSIGALNKRDSLISVSIAQLLPSLNNSRLGQAGLLLKIDVLVEEIRKKCTSETGVLDYKSLLSDGESNGSIELSEIEAALYDNCASLANSFIENGGYADSPPKVYPARAGGMHPIKFGHRRYIAYRLAEPITGITSIDVLVDKDTDNLDDEAKQAIFRIAENTARADNSLAENLHALKPIIEQSKSKEGNKLNIAKLSRHTGIERTKLSRLVDIVELGVADDIELLQYLHSNKLGDAYLLLVIFKNPRNQWMTLLNKLVQNGSAKEFQATIIDTSANTKKEATPKPDALRSVTNYDSDSQEKVKYQEPVTVEQLKVVVGASSQDGELVENNTPKLQKNDAVKIAPKERVEIEKPVDLHQWDYREDAAEAIINVIKMHKEEWVADVKGSSNLDKLSEIIDALAKQMAELK